MDVSFAFSGGGGWGGQGDQNYNGSSSTQRAGAYEKTPIPVSIIELLKVDNSEEKLQIGNYSFSTVKVTGVVASAQIDPDQTCITYELRDPPRKGVKSEPTFTVIRYHGVESYQNTETLREGAYIQAVGKLRLFNDRLSLISFHIAEVSMDKVELFQLEVATALLYYGKGIPACSANQLNNMDILLFNCNASHKSLTGSHATPDRSANDSAVSNVASVPDRRSQQQMAANKRRLSGQQSRNGADNWTKRAYSYRQTELDSFVVSKPAPTVPSPLTKKNNNNHYLNNNPPMLSNPHGLIGQQAKIYDYVRRYGIGEEGVSIKQICAALNVGEDRAFTDIGVLVNRSVLYSTIDEQHFASIDD